MAPRRRTGRRSQRNGKGTLGNDDQRARGLAGQGRTDEPSARPRRPQLVDGIVVAALVVGLLLAFAVLGVVHDVPYKVFTKEVAEQFNAHPYTGFLAHIAWFLWVVAGTVGLLAAAVLRRRGVRDRRVPFFLCASLLTAILLFDDFVMLHDRLLPRIDVPEEALYAVYGVLFVVLLVRFRRQFLAGGAWLALAAGAFWACSLVADFLQEHFEIHFYIVEDGAKILGTALWAAFMVRSSLATIDPPKAGRTRADA